MMKPRQLFLRCLCGAGVLFGGIATSTVVLGHSRLETQRVGEQNPYSLNVRLSSRTIRPPKELIKEVIPLEGMRAARPRVGPPPQAAIIEDDQRRRIIILSTEETGMITVYVLENLNLKPHLSEVSDCARIHHCEDDRMAITGGLGCLAICVKEVVENLIQP